MTQGIVSVRRNGQMIYKIITGHDGRSAADVVLDIREHFRLHNELPDVSDLVDICAKHGFGCSECLVILQFNPCKYNEPNVYSKQDLSEGGEEGKARYLDTFHVAQFNPRWKYGTASYVEVVDL